jgi:hypothetical protein
VSSSVYVKEINILIMKCFCFLPLPLLTHFASRCPMTQLVRIIMGLRTWKAHYRSHKSRLLDNTLSRMNPLSTFTTYLSRIHLNIVYQLAHVTIWLYSHQTLPYPNDAHSLISTAECTIKAPPFPQ